MFQFQAFDLAAVSIELPLRCRPRYREILRPEFIVFFRQDRTASHRVLFDEIRHPARTVRCSSARTRRACRRLWRANFSGIGPGPVAVPLVLDTSAAMGFMKHSARLDVRSTSTSDAPGAGCGYPALAGETRGSFATQTLRS